MPFSSTSPDQPIRSGPDHEDIAIGLFVITFSIRSAGSRRSRGVAREHAGRSEPWRFVRPKQRSVHRVPVAQPLRRWASEPK